MKDIELDDLARFFGEGGSNSMYRTTIDEVIALKKEIKELIWRSSSLVPKEKQQLKDAEERLKNIQWNCSHWFETAVVFTSVRKFCSKCDFEDKNYDYTKDSTRR